MSQTSDGTGLKVVYFASVRERVGVADEFVSPPATVRTVADLTAWLVGRGENYAHAFAEVRTIRAALDHVHVKADAALAGAREVAFFPPMTGG